MSVLDKLREWKKIQLTEIDLKRKLRSNLLFTFLASAYIALTLYVCLVRASNFNLALDYRGDYNIFSSLSRIVSEGISPFTTDVVYAENAGIVPLYYFYYTGSIIFSVIQMKMLSIFIPSEHLARLVTFFTYPMISSIALVYSVHFFGKKLDLSSIQRALMLLLLVFVNDWSLTSFITHPKGEVFGIALGIIACSYYFDKRYSLSSLFFMISVFMHALCSLIPITLLVYNCFRSVLNRKLDLKTFMPMISASLVLITVFCVLSVPVTVHVGSYLPDTVKPAEPDDVYVPSYTSTDNRTHIETITNSSGEATRPASAYFLSREMLDIIKQPFYPFTHAIWAQPPRSALSLVSGFLNYNLTQSQLDDMYALKLTQQNFVPVMVSLFYGVGITTMFVWVMISVKRADLRLLCFSAYLLPLLQTVLSLVSGMSFYPERTMSYVAVFFSMVLAHSTKKIPKVFYVITPLLLFRAVLFVLVITATRGGY